MAAVVRRSISRRVPYERLRKRLAESRLPWDDAAERHAIGALLLAPHDWQRKLSTKLYSGHFYDKGHGWLWEELGTAITKWKLNYVFGDWLQRMEIQRRFNEQFGGGLGREIAFCTQGCFWWHGPWYIGRVLVAAKVRSEVMGSAERLGKALDASDKWWSEQ